jgi:ABC-2 type transport system permease protein
MRPVTAVMYREYLIRRTSLVWMFFDVIVPLLYLLLFGVAFDRAIGTSFIIDGVTVRYNDFFLAGVLSMTCFGNAVNQSYGFFIDRDNGIFYEHLTYPLTRGHLLFGKIIFQGLMTMVQVSLTLLAAALILNVHVQIVMLPIIFLAAVLGTAGWFFSLSNIAFLIRRNDTFNMVINASYFVLMFMSSLFYPIDQIPIWLRIPALFNPLTWHADVMRYLTIGIGNSLEIFIQSLLFIGFLILSFRVAVHTIQHSS